MFKNESFDLSHFYGGDVDAPRKHYRVQPELAFTIAGIDVDVRGFLTLVGIEMESKRSYSQDCRHLAILLYWRSDRPRDETPAASSIAAAISGPHAFAGCCASDAL
jgi:hypothetical protein